MVVCNSGSFIESTSISYSWRWHFAQLILTGSTISKLKTSQHVLLLCTTENTVLQKEKRNETGFNFYCKNHTTLCSSPFQCISVLTGRDTAAGGMSHRHHWLQQSYSMLIQSKTFPQGPTATELPLLLQKTSHWVSRTGPLARCSISCSYSRFPLVTSPKGHHLVIAILWNL